MTEDGRRLLAELTAGMEQLAAWEDVIPPVGHRIWNRQVDRISDTADALLAQPDGWLALQRLAAEHPDSSVRSRAEGYAFPRPPDTVSEMREWLAHPAQRLGHLDLNIEPCLYFAPLSDEESRGFDEGLAEWPRGSWVRGQSTSSGPWPLRDDGIPPVHVAHLDLGFLTQLAAHPLPDVNGVLEVFHDLEAWGLEESDGTHTCWLVRSIPFSTQLLHPPADLEVSPTIWLGALDGVSVAWPENWVERLSEEDVDALTDAQDAIRDDLLTHGQPAPPLQPGSARFTPQMLGHPQLGLGNVVEERLEPFLPLTEPDDAWVLLLDVPGTGPLEGWFGDEGHLEVWIRASDLTAGAYEHCWLTVRTQ